MKHGKTETFEEAQDLFNASPRLRKQLDIAREVRDELSPNIGDILNTKIVKDEMDQRGVLDHEAKHHWMGSLFKGKGHKFAPYGGKIKANGHDDLANNWERVA